MGPQFTVRRINTILQWQCDVESVLRVLNRIWDTAVGIATSYGLDGPEFKSAKRQARL
jgi:hypothetical protein